MALAGLYRLGLIGVGCYICAFSAVFLTYLFAHVLHSLDLGTVLICQALGLTREPRDRIADKRSMLKVLVTQYRPGTASTPHLGALYNAQAIVFQDKAYPDSGDIALVINLKSFYIVTCLLLKKL